jgi:predicted alpha/beta-fold hydrolase
VVVHGLGGCADSPYVVAAAGAAVAANLSCLRLNLRGADRHGEDIYHAGLTDDLHAALASAELASQERVFVLGYSMGGHVGLRAALTPGSSRFAAVAAICPPLDLASTARQLDRTASWPYRRYLLARLCELYAAVSERGRPGPPLDRVRAARSFVEFDSLVIAPRFGFCDAWDYYARVSVGPLLGDLRVPALLVAASDDPMVPAFSLRQSLAAAGGAVDARWVERAGHLGFAGDLSLGVEGALGLEPQALQWLVDQAS